MKTLTPFTLPSLPLTAGATTPAAPIGSLAWSTTAASLFQYDGSMWQGLVSASGVTAVTATGNLASSGGTTPAITMTPTPSFTSVTTSGTETVGALSSSGAVTASQFNGSGAGLTAGTVPNAALATTPVTSVGASGNLSSSGGTTPAIAMTNSPTFTGNLTVNGSAYFTSSSALSIASDGTNGLYRSNGTHYFQSLSGSANAPIIAAAGTFSGALTGVGVYSTGGFYYNTTRLLLTCDGTSTIIRAASAGSTIYVENSGGAILGSFSGSTGVYSSSSDASLKANVVTTHYGIADLLKLEARDFTWIATGAPDVGFIAQEVQAIVPEVVTASPNGLLGMDYSGLVPVIVRALQELSAQFTAYVTAHP